MAAIRGEARSVLTPEMAAQQNQELEGCEQLTQKILDSTQESVLDVKTGLKCPHRPARRSVFCYKSLCRSKSRDA
jgi:hypothetical protein